MKDFFFVILLYYLENCIFFSNIAFCSFKVTLYNIHDDSDICTFIIRQLPQSLFGIGMALVSECPKNKMEVGKASQKLGCGVDKYGNIQYLCLPKKEKTSLVELCIDSVMGIQEKGTLSLKEIICIS